VKIQVGVGDKRKGSWESSEHVSGLSGIEIMDQAFTAIAIVIYSILVEILADMLGMLVLMCG